MLRISKISFPGLGIGEFEVDSVAFSIGDFEIAWYALIITFGIICAVSYTMWRAKQVNVTVDDIIDFALFVVPSGIIGARLYYVIFNGRHDTFAEIINIREGGLAIYGGIIAGALAVFCVSLVKKIPFVVVGDCCTPGIILAQAIGRWGNFMNGEAFGAETDVFCGMGLNNSLTGWDYTVVHPTFLYESLWNLIGFALINVFYRHRKYDGQIILLVFGWYGLGRMLIEGLRSDSLYIGDIRVSQLLAGIVLVACVAVLIWFAVKPPKKELYVKP
ncbi:MAG: prolipoprotein diacylglyceryl transferase [Clostridia bacterium]|nr:prolipoprotein diacylglyceryl transferase [Clostridia bacterium]